MSVTCCMRFLLCLVSARMTDLCNSLEQQDVRLRLVYLVVLPAQTLRDAEPSPLILPQQLERASRAIEVVFGDGLEHLLGQLHVAVLVVVVVVPVVASAVLVRWGSIVMDMMHWMFEAV